MKKWQVEHKEVLKDSKDLLKVILKNRGITSKKETEDFLNPKLSEVSTKSVKIDEASILKSLKRIDKAIKNKEKIIIFGDYDVDGIAASAILWETLNSLKANVLPYIPSRFEEGYGLSKEGIDNLLKKDKVDLIITVDNGIVANEAVDYANKKGIDIIITDHHVPSQKLPKAFSIIHTTYLCGAGVAYLFSKRILKQKIIENDNHLELVVLATIADLVPLTGANRILVYHGILKIRQTKRVGLISLLNSSKIIKDEIDVYQISHIIAPRLNAMGRMSSAMDSLRLICTISKEKAENLTLILTKTNFQRQQVTNEALLHAKSSAEKKGLKNLIFIADESYQQGVVGLIAGRLVEEYYLPSIVISKGEKFSKASVRSVKGFNVIEFLRTASDLLVDVGGHPMAAGFTVETKNLELLEKKLFDSSEKLLKKEHLERSLRIDVQLDHNLINTNTYLELLKLKPFGMANPEPTFLTKELEVENIRLIGNESKHLKLRLKKGNMFFDGIGFGMGDKNLLKVGDKVNIVYTIDQNNWNGNRSLQLKLKDLQI